MPNGTSVFDQQYQRGPILGRGASGVAFIVRPKLQPELQFVAKELCLVRSDEKRRRDAFVEGQLLRDLSHKNIVRCFDVFQDDEMMYIVMEYANGGDLSGRIQARKAENRRFSENTVMFVFVQICTALQYIHSRKIVHRDLKPPNVFVVGEGELQTCTVKLGDFGIAKMIECTMGQAHSTVGTPSYLSPEICKNNPYGMKSDIWSLGIILYELACLKVPFSAGNLPAMALMICTSEPKPLPEEFGAALTELVKALLQKDPAKRPQVAMVLQNPYVSRVLVEDDRAEFNGNAANDAGHIAGADPRPAACQTMPDVQNGTSSISLGGSQPIARGSSQPTKMSAGRATGECGQARLPSCGPSTRTRHEKILMDEGNWAWRRPCDQDRPSMPMPERGGGQGKGRPTPRIGKEKDVHPRPAHRSGLRSDRGERQAFGPVERSERFERLAPDRATPDQGGDFNGRGVRQTQGERYGWSETGAWTACGSNIGECTLELVVTPEHSGLADTDEDFAAGMSLHNSTASCNGPEPPGSAPTCTSQVLPPAEMLEPPPPFAEPPSSSVSLAALMTGAHAHEVHPRMRNRIRRRGRPPLLAGQEAMENGDVRSPPRQRPSQRGLEAASSSPGEQQPIFHATASIVSAPQQPVFSHSTAPVNSVAGLPAAARSVSPARKVAALKEGGELPVPAPMLRSSGSAPALPPLPPLVAPARGAVRSRSVAGIHDNVRHDNGRAHDGSRGYSNGPHMFKTAPLPISADRNVPGDLASSTMQSWGPPPPSLAPPPQQPPPPPPQRQATRDESSAVRLAPKLPLAVVGQSDNRHWRNDRESAPIIPAEGWGDVDPRLASARLQSVV
mmetsp:Transcript_88274/g.248554  ORF Transcript_88274/g.248554 Transcript_88274/m.248554 type:complete len:845 (+) Transcript_88274:97-2631(+)|eukprot:CAMPEP_0117471940 /NCGR_PEP_ID=MMETSP0784-20121206/7988_1 /TAXON_ID=39447 /ORGANISM="" /LENGTH=844 /DNA_ID=CAMNT_0005266071 /DNA_START=26 /DNA_END=2560 /DNA_ORIENTATION=+